MTLNDNPDPSSPHSIEPIRGNEGGSILGPRNLDREAQSRDRLTPPITDAGTLPNLKWSFADSHMQLLA